MITETIFQLDGMGHVLHPEPVQSGCIRGDGLADGDGDRGDRLQPDRRRGSTATSIRGSAMTERRRSGSNPPAQMYEPIADPGDDRPDVAGDVRRTGRTSSRSSTSTGSRSRRAASGRYARRRFFRHRLAMASLIVLRSSLLAGVFAKQIAPYAYDQQDFAHSEVAPTLRGNHFFGTDMLGRDYFSRVALRHPELRAGRVPRGDRRDVHRDRHRGRLRVLQRVDGQPADAVHRLNPDATGARGAVDRRRIPRAPASRRGSRSSLRFSSGRPRANRARELPVAAREGVRRGREGGRLRRPPDHVPPHPPELHRPDRRRTRR